MREKRNDLHNTALFVKGRNMQILAEVQLPERYLVLM